MYLVQFIEWMDEIYVEENSRIQMCEEQVKLIVHFSNAIPLQCSDPSVSKCVEVNNDDISIINHNFIPV